jgi:integrase
MSNEQHEDDAIPLFLAPKDTPTRRPASKPPRKSAKKPPKRRPEGTRAPNGAGSVYFSEADGLWHGRIIVGVKDDGTPDRRHRTGKSEKEVNDKLDKLRADVAKGTLSKPGRVPTVAEWLTHWVENIESRTARFKTMEKHRGAVYKYLIPGVGAHRMDRIRSEHLEKLYTKIETSGQVSNYVVLQVHRTARAAFNEALRRGVIAGRNVVSDARTPQIEEVEREPIEPDDAQRIITAALKRRNGVRFVLALALGIRQGEALGIRWERLDERKRVLKLPRQLQRQTWQHGCDDRRACGATWHKTEPCRQPCKRHTRPCPPPCGSECTGHARHCPQRHGGGLKEVPVKSRAGRRGWVIPEPLWKLIEAHREQQDAEREFAGTAWMGDGLMFTQIDGRPIDPRADRHEWKELLGEANVPEVRLHDARHTAATVLAFLEVAPRVAMELMGWSASEMMLRYQHVTDAMKRDVADRIGNYFWKPEEPQRTDPEAPKEPDSETN